MCLKVHNIIFNQPTKQPGEPGASLLVEQTSCPGTDLLSTIERHYNYENRLQTLGCDRYILFSYIGMLFGKPRTTPERCWNEFAASRSFYDYYDFHLQITFWNIFICCICLFVCLKVHNIIFDALGALAFISGLWNVKKSRLLQF